MATKKCPLCAEEIQAGGAGLPVLRRPVRRRGPAGARGAPTAAGGGPAGRCARRRPRRRCPRAELREGTVPSGRQLFGFYLETIAVAAALLVTVFGFGGGALGWAERGLGFAPPRPDLHRRSASLILVAWSIGVRALQCPARRLEALRSRRLVPAAR